MFNVRILPWWAYGLSCLLFFLDQLSKQWISSTLEYGQPHVFTHFFNFTLLHNTGAAFSLLHDAGGWQRWFFAVIASVVSIVIIVWMARLALQLSREKRWEILGLALILGGALGNLYDRILLGYVVDFIVVHYKQYYWPAFNVADMSVSVGAGVLILDMLRKPKNESHQVSESP